MAEKTNRRNRNDIFWSKMDKADEDDEDAFVPGITAPGNRRPSRPRCRKPKEVRASIPSRQPLVENMGPSPDNVVKPVKSRPHKKPERPASKQSSSLKTKDSTYEDISTCLESFAERSIHQLKQASLRDLCPEDKQRVANLIKELARLGEEKEKIVTELHGERESNEKQVMTLVGQQEHIIREREEIQEKLFQCQKLLTEYQAQLLNKQDRLTTSVSEIRQPSKTKEAEKSKHKPGSSREPVPVQQVKVIEVCPPSISPASCVNPTMTPVDTESKMSASKRKSANQNQISEILTIEKPDSHDAVADLLSDDRDFRDGIKRPFTAMIDKEIARERSLSQSSRGSERSRSRSVSPAIGRPHFAYPQNLAGIGPLRDPIASSTHKSTDINAQLMSHINEPTSPQSSIRGFSIRGSNSQKQSSKVVFNEEYETDEFAEKHSPNIKGNNSGSFKDPQYAEYYKKLSPAGRRRELLRQRQALLDEQEKLKLVLEKQEQQLKDKHVAYEQRQELQRQRMEFYKEGGKFPAFKLDFDAADSERGGEAGSEAGALPRETVVVEMEPGERGLDVTVTTPRDADNVQIDGDVCVRNVVSASTSPVTTPRRNRITTSTSPVRSRRDEVGVEDEDEDLPRLIDVATSISYRSPLQDTSNRQQGNLPLYTNRQKQKQTAPTLVEPPKQTRALGEKTLNVLELVNSLEEEPEVIQRYGTPDIENRPILKYSTKSDQPSPYRQFNSPGNLRTSLNRNRGSGSLSGTSPDKLRTSQDKFRTSQGSRGKLLTENEESAEESQILEDVFFL